MNKLKIVSYWVEPNSRSSFYETSSKNLIADCKKFKLDYHIIQIENKGGYWANCGFKPFFIKECMETFTEQNILWVDVDSRITKDLSEIVPKTTFDFGAVLKGDPRLPFFGHCLLFNQTEKARALINDYTEVYKTTRDGDHACMIISLKRIIGVENVYKISPSFLKIGSAPKHIVLK